MPEYLAPGVYVEEVSFRSKSIEGVSTTTTGFVGPTRYGPVYDPPDILTSLADFEAVYGDRQQLVFEGDAIDNYMWHAVRAFFNEGGKRLYVKRIYHPTDAALAQFEGDEEHADFAGCARGSIAGLRIWARYPGEYGNFHVRFTLQVGQNVLAFQGTPPEPHVRGVSDRDVVLVETGGASTFALARSYLDPATGSRTWRFDSGGSMPNSIELESLASNDTVQVVTVDVSVTVDEPGALPRVWAGLPLDPNHELGGMPDSMFAIFDKDSLSAQGTPIVIERDPTTDFDSAGYGGLAGVQVLEDVFDAAQTPSPGGITVEAALLDAAEPDSDVTPDARSVDVILGGGAEGGGQAHGDDGALPTDSDYEGTTRLSDNKKTGLVSFEDIDDISIVAAPGSSHNYLADRDKVHAIINSLITHAQKMRYRIAVIDAGNGLTVQQVREMRAQHDSSWAAFYYPWIRILDPLTNQDNEMPPSGFVAGIYARNDTNRAVYKAPANEVVNLAIGFEQLINKGQQEVLNPEGINCFRFFEGRGYRLWGARTMSSDSEWKYVNLRRYFAYLEHSIDKGTQWAVFEPNGEILWAMVRRTIDEFLLNEWQGGALLGDKPEKAYFVRCDRSTMTQNDLDNGRLVCLIGVAPLRPAEFVIFRIGQWTADAKLR